jgi:NlpC/P60 family putative phage cell wall peptidase
VNRARIVAEARGWIGTPYRHQASLRGVGCDCLGLVRGIWRACVGPEPEPVPAYAPDWAEAGSAEDLLNAGHRHFTPVDKGQFSEGDVLVFRWRDHVAAKHVAIATSGSTMIHAHDGACVCEVSITPGWRRRIVGTFAFPI